MTTKGSVDNWQEQSLCQNLDAFTADNLFFLTSGKKSKQAQNFCDPCPVRQECIIVATLNDEKGVWGGTTDKDRDSFFAKVSAREQAKKSPYESVRRLAV